MYITALADIASGAPRQIVLSTARAVSPALSGRVIKEAGIEPQRTPRRMQS
jgi:hypothetical protein